MSVRLIYKAVSATLGSQWAVEKPVVAKAAADRWLVALPDGTFNRYCPSWDVAISIALHWAATR